MMDNEKKRWPDFPLLDAEQISVKVKQVNKNGAVLLLYKNARVDMDMLDAAIGPGRWQNDYKRDSAGTLACGIAVDCTGDGGWVWKWDSGVESRNDGDGNEKKGEYSDAFKRAGFRWGIGRELYTAPFIFAYVATQQNGSRWELQDRIMKFRVSEIGYDDRRRISRLVIVDQNGNTTYRMGGAGARTSAAADAKPAPAEPAEQPAAAAQRPPQSFQSAPLISEGQIKYIHSLCNQAQVDALKAKYNIAHIREMPRATASQVIDRLKKRRTGNDAV